MNRPFIPDDVARATYEMVLTPTLVSRSPLFQRPPLRPQPWYRQLWRRIDRYLPRVRVWLGPRSEWED